MAEAIGYTSSADKVITRMWRVRQTTMQMVADRGYELTEEEVNLPLDDFKRNYLDQSGNVNEDMIRKHTAPATAENPYPEPDCGHIRIQFNGDDNMGIQHVKNFIVEVVENKCKAAILVTHAPLTSAARKHIAAADMYAHIETFVEDDLIVNITHHVLVPRHVLLSKEEKIALLQRYRLKETQLPRILHKDPVARYLGLLRGQVVKIIRDSETAGRYASYRLCI